MLRLYGKLHSKTHHFFSVNHYYFFTFASFNMYPKIDNFLNILAYCSNVCFENTMRTQLLFTPMNKNSIMFQPMGMQRYNVAMLEFEKQLITKESKCTF
jgi:hypothetical protein